MSYLKIQMHPELYKCVGCSSKEIANTTILCKAGSFPQRKDKVCPCISCLTKSMCDEICDKFIKHTGRKVRYSIFDNIKITKKTRPLWTVLGYTD